MVALGGVLLLMDKRWGVCEGGVIAGKAVCEDLCCSGSSFATARGPVRNPHNEAFAAGGSSSGCGALVRHGQGQSTGGKGSDGGIEEVMCGGRWRARPWTWRSGLTR